MVCVSVYVLLCPIHVLFSTNCIYTVNSKQIAFTYNYKINKMCLKAPYNNPGSIQILLMCVGAY